MKTLYININGEAIQSDENIEVIGSAEDSIIDSFYISLGMVIADGVACVKYKPLVADFAKEKPDEFKSFFEQWNEIKGKLLSDNPFGDVNFVLSSEYLDWLKMNVTYSAIYYKKYQNQRQVNVRLSIDELYEDTVDSIRRKVVRFLQNGDKYQEFDKFVINDEIINRHSLLVRSIKSKFEDIAFVLYEKWFDSKDVCPKCGKKPCECPSEKMTCPKCGKNPCECTPEDSVCCKCDNNLCKLKKGNNNTSEKQDVLFEKEIESDKEWSADDVRKLERFFPQYIGGLDYIGKSGEDYLLYGYKDKPRDRNNADVVTSLGKMLFALKREDGIVVTEVLPSGLLVIEKCEEDGTTHYGIVCKYGKILIPCEKGEHKSRNSEYRRLEVWEKTPGVIKFPYEKFYINAYTREQYVDVAGDYGLKIKSENNDSLIDVVNINNVGIITKDATIDNGTSLLELGNGWYLVKVLKRTGKGRVDKVSMVFNEERSLFLEEKEIILEFESKSFINNDRIITAITYGGFDTCGGWRYFSEIRIRDYSGNIIKAISSPHLYITDPYNYGKLAAFIVGEDEIAQSLIYFDMQGNEHLIPFNIEYFHYSKLRAYFVSETQLEFSNYKSRKRSCIININGSTL